MGTTSSRHELLWQNLYRSNNLENLTYGGGNGVALASPKVVILTRAELLASRPNYAPSFAPIEVGGDSTEKNEPLKALRFFDEIRIARAAACSRTGTAARPRGHR